MKKIIFCILISLMFLGISVDTGKTQTPPVTVTIGLNGLKHDIGLPINMDVTVQNEGEDDIITSHGFRERDFFLDLTFIIDGKGIVADAITAEGPIGEPLMPPMITVEDQGEFQVLFAEQVEILEGTLNLNGAFFTHYEPPFNVHDHYTLTQAGRYEVEAKIPIRVYPGITHTIEDENGVLVDFAELEPVDFDDFITTSIPLILVEDADGDDYYTESFGTIHPDEADCDDNDFFVNPGADEITGNGKDDDCDPTTPDVISIVVGTINVKADLHTVGRGKNPGSTKEGIEGMSIKVYNMQSSCVRDFGVSWHNYRSIWGSSGCVPAAFGVTDANGMVSLQVLPGNYIVIGFYDSDTYIGVSAGGVGAGTTKDKYLQVIVDADGNLVPAKFDDDSSDSKKETKTKETKIKETKTKETKTKETKEKKKKNK